MTTKTRIYRTKVPFTVEEWRKGQRYVLAKYSTDEVKIIQHTFTKSDGSVITETHKEIDLSKRIPGVVRKVINGNAVTVDEYSTTVDIMCFCGKADLVVTKQHIKTDGLLKEMNIEKVQEIKEIKHKGDPMKDVQKDNLEEDVDTKIGIDLSKINKQGKPCKSHEKPKSTVSTLASTCETRYVNRQYDTNTFSLLVKTIVKEEEEENLFEEEGAKFQKYDLSEGKEPFCYVYKLLSVTVNSMFFGWVADHVKNAIRDMINKFHEQVISTEKEWRNIKEEELVKLEEEMMQKYMKK